MKLIFLDVDGVLNHSQSLGWGTTWRILDGTCVGELHRIIERTGAKVVLSSTWRLSTEGCRSIAEILGNDLIGKTPLTHMSQAPRKDDILEWLESVWQYTYGWNGEKITHMAILDDERDADLGDGSFFKTGFEEGGLTEIIADQVIEHLLKPSVLI